MRSLASVVLLVACGGDGVHHLADSCVPGIVEAAATTPATFACHANFTSQLMLTNGTCDPVTITSIELAGTVTTGQCVPPTTSMYTPQTATVAAGATATILDLTAGPFCCFQMACPASFQCDESYTFTITTSAGTVTASPTMSHLDLDSCDVICP